MSTENTLLERFLPLLHEIASNLESGLVSYVNYETLEVELIPADFVDDLDEYKSICGDDIEIQHLNWDSYFWITPPSSSVSYTFMEDFVEAQKDCALKTELQQVLQKNKPFARFNSIIHVCEFREAWFEFRAQCYQKYVYNEMVEAVADLERPAFEGGYFNDDGTRIDPDKILIPSKCMMCRDYHRNNEFDNILCNLTRCDYDGQSEFKCGSFKPI